MGFALPDLDQETIDELILSIHEAIDEMEPALDQLVSDPERADILNDLFRHLHTMKGNLRMCFMDPYTDYVHEMEDLISEIRKGRLHFSAPLKDAYLLGLDKLRDHTDVICRQGECETDDMKVLGGYFKQLAASEPDKIDALAVKLFGLNGGGTSAGASGADSENNLAFFKRASQKLDQRLPNRAGRTELLETLAGLMQHQIPDEIDWQQLQVAIYLHDIGLGTLDAKQLDDADSQPMRQHPTVGLEYLSKHPEWGEAATMISQHHEYLDGSGYPGGITNSAIHPGARLVGLLSDFYDLLVANSDLTERRAVLKALTEISHHDGSRYDSKMVSLLTEAAREHFGH